jgi:DNA-binding MarR family transcriptional regulator
VAHVVSAPDGLGGRIDQGLVVREHREGRGTFVRVTPSGRALLKAHRNRR